jgi:hypothetical protein
MKTQIVNKRILRWLGISLSTFAFTLIFLGLVATRKAYYERSKAEELITILSQLEVGVSSEQEVRSLTERFGRYRIEQDAQRDEQSRADVFGFQNGAAWLLNMIPAKTVMIRLQYENNVLTQKEFVYAESPGIRGSLREESGQQAEHDALAFLRKNGRVLSINNGAPPYRSDIPVQIAVVVDDASSPLARRRLDWSIDLNCMTRLRDCPDLRLVLNGALEETSRK